MILNNLTNLITLKQIKSTGGAVTSSYTKSTALSFLNGEVATSGQGKSRVAVGTNGDPVTSEDYQITTNADISLIGIVSNTKDTKEVMNCTASFENIGNSDISIKEVGLLCEIDSFTYLLTRKKLSEPIVLSPGNTYDIRYTLSLHNY